MGIAFVSLTVWAHHMFTVGMTSVSNAFFVLSTMMVGIPTGIKIFNWLATMWGGRIRFATPMLFCTAFLFQFLIAGLTGIMLSVAPWDWQLHNSYFVIAHFHYVLVGAIVFCIFAAIYYWYPKATGRMLSEKLGKWHFWLFLIGFHVTFDTMHFVGHSRHAALHLYLRGRSRMGHAQHGHLDRRHYPGHRRADLRLEPDSTPIFTARRPATIPGTRGRWSGPRLRRRLRITLRPIPVVRSRRPLWDLKHPNDPDWKYER